MLAKKIAYLWAQKKLLSDVDILFLLFLRDPELQNVKTPEQLIEYMCKRLNKEQLKSCIDQIEELKVCIVMDGFDEYPIKLRKKSFIADLIKGKVFYNSIVVVTSRPTATISLHDKVDRRVEILGFAQKERDIYISDSLDSPEQGKQLQDYLKCQPIINGLVYVPLHLAILLYLFKKQSKLPETLTEMNESFILHTIYQSLTKNELTSTGPVTVVADMNDLPKNIINIIKGLSKLAFAGLQDDKLVFSYDEIKANCSEIENDIPGAFNGFGLLQVVQHFPKTGAGTTVSFNFLHFTMQEYLASLYVSTAIPYEQQLSLMEETFWSSKYNFMWMMYVGISGINSQIFMQFLYKAQPGEDIMNLALSGSIQRDRLKCLHLFQCFMEAKSETVPKEISSIFHDNEINFHGLRLLPHHVSSLILYISKYSMQLESLNVRDCHIGDVGMSILEHFFTANPDKASSIKHIDLFGNNSVLLWSVYCAVFGQQNLTKLNWSSLGGVNIEEIVSVIDNNTTVQSLDLSDNHFNDGDVEKIVNGFFKNNTLQELDLSDNSITTKGARLISEFLQSGVKLRMSWNNHFIDTGNSSVDYAQKSISDVDTRIVANILCKNNTVTKLDLSQNRITANGAKSISKCIECNKSLKEIDVSKNKISNFGLTEIAIAMKKNKTLQSLNVSFNNISDDGAVAISECLENNNTLQEFNISNNRITNNGAIAIIKCLKNNYMLQALDLSHNKISDEGIINIGKALKINATLQIIDISCNNISDNGALAISEFLRSNNTLQELNVSDNEITSEGVVMILENIHSNSPLHSLNLSKNIICKSELMMIYNSYKILKTIATVQISYNKIIDDSQNISTIFVHSDYVNDKKFKKNSEMKLNMQNKSGNYKSMVLCCCAKDNKFIKALDISYHYISDTGAKIIGKAVQANKSLQKLDISHNNLSDDGTVAFSECLLNNYTLKELDLSHNKISNDGAVAISECLKNNNALQELGMSHNAISDKGIINIGEALQMNTTLQILDISHNNFSDNGVLTFSDYLKGKNTLYQLKISWNDIDMNLNFNVTSLDISCKYKKSFSNIGAILLSKILCCNTNILKLDISCSDISSDGAVAISEFLKNNQTLQELDISNNRISNGGAVAISECLKNNKTLQELDMSHNAISDKGIINIGEALLMNKTLQILDISHNHFSDNGVLTFSDYLREKYTLRHLKISWNDIDLNLNFNVTSLDISCKYEKSFSNTRAILLSKILCFNTNILNLDISYSDISSGGAVAISECLKNNKTLQGLDISNNRISDDGAVAISECLKNNNTLQKFDISNNKISDDGAVAISGCLKNNKTLQELNMSHNAISDKGIINIGEALQMNATLQILDISHNNFSENGVLTLSVYLRGKITLRQLKISLNDNMSLKFNVISRDISCKFEKTFSNIAAILLFKILYYDTNILKLDISNSDISSDGAVAISECFKNNQTLQELDISNNRISDDGAVAISECLKNNNTLQKLNMSHNEVSDIGIINIGKAMQINTHLQTLIISYNSIFYDGAVAISECLKNNQTLQELDISNNKISDDGAVAISGCLKNNNTLRELIMSSNKIHGDGAVAISESLLINNTLHKLSLSWDSTTTTEEITKIAEAIAVNKGLHSLDLSSQRVNDPVYFTMTLLTALEHNHTMMILVLPPTVNKDGNTVRNKLSKVNEGRRNKGISQLVLNIKLDQIYLLHHTVRGHSNLLHRTVRDHSDLLHHTVRDHNITSSTFTSSMSNTILEQDNPQFRRYLYNIASFTDVNYFSTGQFNVFQMPDNAAIPFEYQRSNSDALSYKERFHTSTKSFDTKYPKTTSSYKHQVHKSKKPYR